MCGIVGSAPAQPGALSQAGGAADRDALRDGQPRQRLDRCRRLRRSALVTSRTWGRLGGRRVRRRRRCRLHHRWTARRRRRGPDGRRHLPGVGRRDVRGAARCGQGGVPAGIDRRLRRRPGRAQGRRASGVVDRRMGAGQGAGLAGCRPHQDGDRVRGHARGLPPLRGRTRTVHGTQRLVRQPRHHPARTAFSWSRIRQRERHRSGSAVHRQAAGRRPRCGVGVEGALRDVRRLLHAAGVQPTTRSRWSATRSRASPPSSPRPPTGSRWAANTALWQDFPVSRMRPSGSRSRR